ncbi:aldo/keto reductase [Pediococcus damnosus]|uniref:aldo/keto reductase n=1 Tax=Pediococcus damnosus TaxID=51663 RepID=UPI00062C033B|nr:aldo/keto reductase [Pediococcus damnosus]AMV60217.1 oxidoreductase of aldo/keto reductase family, subgroup 1 [Pediococcus damnosus]AMV64467.1 oxidoreductase of aldo/keto reductase family, subgroup 1 [Pediococcus damnosus]AMV69673.1 oxidoreductase of aldo/keto reductase family, subgroup 1 [Pediococcus damnosus]PIO81398.1 2,5-diketo-D-gluconic acid reductase [Pediococcus damnosus]PIO85062.1 2,5-diketo-D-gluconic acid reductase [Pediococcus damnosus]
MSHKIPQIKFNDGTAFPQIGFGTYKLNGATGVSAIRSALDNGYRALDSAYNYENHGALGEAIRQSDIPRSQIMITSKLPGRHHKYTEALENIQESLYQTGLKYFDLYLIHWPNPKEDHYVEAWKALIDAQKWGLVRSIGVSNFLPEHIDRLIDETEVVPAVNQIELHPYFSQAPQRKYDADHHIVTEAWSPLGRASAVLEDPVIKKIADAHHKSVGQVILRWEIQLGVLPIPKSSSTVRQRENLHIFNFELNEEEMTAITNLDCPDGRNKNQDPAVYEEF